MTDSSSHEGMPRMSGRLEPEKGAVLTWRLAREALEGPGEVALIGESGIESDFGQW